MERMLWQPSDMQNPSSHNPETTENSCHRQLFFSYFLHKYDAMLFAVVYTVKDKSQNWMRRG